MNTKLSVIIPNYNGARLLKACLDSVSAQTFKDYEVIVVDDASTDDSLKILSQSSARVIVNEKNLGFAGTVNRGIRAARADFVLLLNNDVVLKPDFLEKIYAALEGRPERFSVSSKMLRYYERDTIDDAGDNYTVFGWVYKRGDGLPEQAYEKPGPVFSTCGGAGLYRKDVMEHIGYLDEKHFAYLEDVDLCWRAKIYGYENWYAPQAQCYHIGSATLAAGQKYSEQKVRLSARNNLYIIYKNMPPVQIAINLPFLLTGFGVKYLYFKKRGYGSAYTSGLKEGFNTLKSLRRVPYQPGHLRAYIGIEGELFKNAFVYAALKLAERAVRVLGAKKLSAEADS